VAQANLLGGMGLLEASLVTPGNVEPYDAVKAFNRVKRTATVPWEFVPDVLDHLTAPSLKKLPSAPTAPVAAAPAQTPTDQPPAK